jgi:exopolysaccharide biosynthesis polyprenyl glycosylphosphotransferase
MMHSVQSHPGMGGVTASSLPHLSSSQVNGNARSAREGKRGAVGIANGKGASIGPTAEAPDLTTTATRSTTRKGRGIESALRLRITTAERQWLLRLTDLLVLNLALMGALALRFPYRFGLSTLREAPIYFILLSLLWFLWAGFFECYDLSRSADPGQSAWAAARAAFLAAASYLAIPYYTPDFLSSRLSSVLFVGLVAASLPLWRALYASIFNQPTFQQRLLIVGAGRSGAELARALAGTPHLGNPHASLGVHVVGFVDDDPATAETMVEGIAVLGDRYALRQLVVEHRVDTVVLAITHLPQIHPELLQILLDCREQGIEIEPLVSIYERLTGRVPVELAALDLEAILPASQSALQRVFLTFKRLVDLMAACLGLLAGALLAPCVALANALTSPGPILYWQTRVGRRGRPFRLVKFRSMVPDAEEQDGAVWASVQDSRVTPVGRFLRRTRLDELPQFWNVLRGEMSLVGPRPERPEFVAELVGRLPFYQARHAVRPGITGWAQVRYGYGSSEQDALIKLQYDLYYIKHQSLYLELAILVRTAAVMLGFRGR